MGALRIGPIAFLSICGALPSGMGISVQKEKNEAPPDCHHYRGGFTEHRVFDKGSPHGQLIIPHSPSPHATLRKQPFGALIRLFSPLEQKSWGKIWRNQQKALPLHPQKQ